MDQPNFRIVLVHPLIPENVGFVARNMKAFGFADLCLVKPDFEWNNKCASYKTACGSNEVLDRVVVYNSIEEAVADTHQVIGFSRRKFDVVTPSVEFNQWIDVNFNKPIYENTALLFGSENFGLDRQAIGLCTYAVTILQHDQKLSLNLSHAVGIVLYEIFKKVSVCDEIHNPHLETVNQHQIQLLVEKFENIRSTNNENNPEMNKRHQEILLNYLQRSQINRDEYSVLMGYLRNN